MGLVLAALTSLSTVHAQETATQESATQESATQQSSTGPLPAALAGANLLPDADEDGLKPGESLWLPAAQNATGAPLAIIVNLSAQRAYVYRDGEPIAVTASRHDADARSRLRASDS